MDDSTTRLVRIANMEHLFDEVSRVLSEMDRSLDAFEGIKPKIETLSEYLDGGQWKEDFEADEKGEIPASLKRGVLSEDGLYDLLTEVGRISGRMKELLP